MQAIQRLLLLLSFLALANSVNAQWINEIHYDDNLSDENEGIEITGIAGLDLSCYSLVFYNGFNDEVYKTVNLSGIISNQACSYGTICWY